MSRVVVIGGGIAGLATAALAARDGHSVVVLEKNDTVGGRVGSWEKDGFRFDTGPSWYLMPDAFDHFFRLLGSSADAELDLRVLDPGYRVFVEAGGDPVDLRPSAEANAATFEALETGAGDRLRAYLDSARRTSVLATEHVLYAPDSWRTLLAPGVLRHAGRLLVLAARSLARHVARSVTHPTLRQILGYPAVLLGTSPDRAPAIYHLMSHFDLADGVRYPHGGFVAVIEAVRRLAEREGVEIRTGASVTAIRTVPGTGPGTARRATDRVAGLRYLTADGVEHTIDAEVVVSAADLHHTETTLVPPGLRTYPERWWVRRDPGPGAVLLCLGVRGALPELAHHSLFFTTDWQANFDAIHTPPTRVPEPASLYVCRPSASDGTVAPPGAENLFVLVPVPADPSIGLGGIDGAGDPLVEKVADSAVDQIARWAGIPDLAERIVVRRTIGPGDFVRDLHAWSGGALGPAHTLRQSAVLRARNASSRIDGLLYAGSSTVPGIGLPMCLISAELVLKRLRGDTSAGPLPEPAAERRAGEERR